MERVLIWDLAVRAFHWALAVCVGGALTIGLLVDDESPLFVYHAALGLMAAVVVMLRLVWGIVAEKHGGLRDFMRTPAELTSYLGDIAGGRSSTRAGHNPGSAWAAVAMFALIIGLVATGIQMGSGAKVAEDVHESMAYLLGVVVIAHLVGIGVHTFQHGENIAMSMLDGRKIASAEDALSSGRPMAAAVLLGVLGMFSWCIYRGVDVSRGSVGIPILGSVIQVGESEGMEARESRREHPEDDDD